MGWKIMPVHRVAHIAPTAPGAGTIDTGYSRGNLSTLDPNVRCRLTTSGASAFYTIWDRGATALSPVNGAALINHDFTTSDLCNIQSNTSTSYPGTVRGALTPSADWQDSFVDFAADNTERYLFFAISSASPTATLNAGVVTVGQHWDINNPVTNSAWSASAGDGVKRFQFNRISEASAHAIRLAWQRERTWDVSSDIQDGVGGASGENPVVLYDSDGHVYYGPASLDFSWYGPDLFQLNVSITDIRRRSAGNTR